MKSLNMQRYRQRRNSLISHLMPQIDELGRSTDRDYSLRFAQSLPALRRLPTALQEKLFPELHGDLTISDLINRSKHTLAEGERLNTRPENNISYHTFNEGDLSSTRTETNISNETFTEVERSYNKRSESDGSNCTFTETKTKRSYTKRSDSESSTEEEFTPKVRRSRISMKKHHRSCSSGSSNSCRCSSRSSGSCRCSSRPSSSCRCSSVKCCCSCSVSTCHSYGRCEQREDQLMDTMENVYQSNLILASKIETLCQLATRRADAAVKSIDTNELEETARQQTREHEETARKQIKEHEETVRKLADNVVNIVKETGEAARQQTKINADVVKLHEETARCHEETARHQAEINAELTKYTLQQEKKSQESKRQYSEVTETMIKAEREETLRQYAQVTEKVVKEKEETMRHLSEVTENVLKEKEETMRHLSEVTENFLKEREETMRHAISSQVTTSKELIKLSTSEKETVLEVVKQYTDVSKHMIKHMAASPKEKSDIGEEVVTHLENLEKHMRKVASNQSTIVVSAPEKAYSNDNDSHYNVMHESLNMLNTLRQELLEIGKQTSNTRSTEKQTTKSENSYHHTVAQKPQNVKTKRTNHGPQQKPQKFKERRTSHRTQQSDIVQDTAERNTDVWKSQQEVSDESSSSDEHDESSKTVSKKQRSPKKKGNQSEVSMNNKVQNTTKRNTDVGKSQQEVSDESSSSDEHDESSKTVSKKQRSTKKKGNRNEVSMNNNVWDTTKRNTDDGKRQQKVADECSLPDQTSKTVSKKQRSPKKKGNRSDVSVSIKVQETTKRNTDDGKNQQEASDESSSSDESCITVSKKQRSRKKRGYGSDVPVSNDKKHKQMLEKQTASKDKNKLKHSQKEPKPSKKKNIKTVFKPDMDVNSKESAKSVTKVDSQESKSDAQNDTEEGCAVLCYGSSGRFDVGSSGSGAKTAGSSSTDSNQGSLSKKKSVSSQESTGKKDGTATKVKSQSTKKKWKAFFFGSGKKNGSHSDSKSKNKRKKKCDDVSGDGVLQQEDGEQIVTDEMGLAEPDTTNPNEIDVNLHEAPDSTPSDLALEPEDMDKQELQIELPSEDESEISALIGLHPTRMRRRGDSDSEASAWNILKIAYNSDTDQFMDKSAKSSSGETSNKQKEMQYILNKAEPLKKRIEHIKSLQAAKRAADLSLQDAERSERSQRQSNQTMNQEASTMVISEIEEINCEPRDTDDETPSSAMSSAPPRVPAIARKKHAPQAWSLQDDHQETVSKDPSTDNSPNKKKFEYSSSESSFSQGHARTKSLKKKAAAPSCKPATEMQYILNKAEPLKKRIEHIKSLRAAKRAADLSLQDAERSERSQRQSNQTTNPEASTMVISEIEEINSEPRDTDYETPSSAMSSAPPRVPAESSFSQGHARTKSLKKKAAAPSCKPATEMQYILNKAEPLKKRIEHIKSLRAAKRAADLSLQDAERSERSQRQSNQTTNPEASTMVISEIEEINSEPRDTDYETPSSAMSSAPPRVPAESSFSQGHARTKSLKKKAAAPSCKPATGLVANESSADEKSIDVAAVKQFAYSSSETDSKSRQSKKDRKQIKMEAKVPSDSVKPSWCVPCVKSSENKAKQNKRDNTIVLDVEDSTEEEESHSYSCLPNRFQITKILTHDRADGTKLKENKEESKTLKFGCVLDEPDSDSSSPSNLFKETKTEVPEKEKKLVNPKPPCYMFKGLCGSESESNSLTPTEDEIKKSAVDYSDLPGWDSSESLSGPPNKPKIITSLSKAKPTDGLSNDTVDKNWDEWDSDSRSCSPANVPKVKLTSLQKEHLADKVADKDWDEWDSSKSSAALAKSAEDELLKLEREIVPIIAKVNKEADLDKPSTAPTKNDEDELTKLEREIVPIIARVNKEADEKLDMSSTAHTESAEDELAKLEKEIVPDQIKETEMETKEKQIIGKTIETTSVKSADECEGEINEAPDTKNKASEEIKPPNMVKFNKVVMAEQLSEMRYDPIKRTVVQKPRNTMKVELGEANNNEEEGAMKESLAEEGDEQPPIKISPRDASTGQMPVGGSVSPASTMNDIHVTDWDDSESMQYPAGATEYDQKQAKLRQIATAERNDALPLSDMDDFSYKTTSTECEPKQTKLRQIATTKRNDALPLSDMDDFSYKTTESSESLQDMRELPYDAVIEKPNTLMRNDPFGGNKTEIPSIGQSGKSLETRLSAPISHPIGNSGISSFQSLSKAPDWLTMPSKQQLAPVNELCSSNKSAKKTKKESKKKKKTKSSENEAPIKSAAGPTMKNKSADLFSLLAPVRGGLKPVEPVLGAPHGPPGSQPLNTNGGIPSNEQHEVSPAPRRTAVLPSQQSGFNTLQPIRGSPTMLHGQEMVAPIGSAFSKRKDSLVPIRGASGGSSGHVLPPMRGSLPSLGGHERPVDHIDHRVTMPKRAVSLGVMGHRPGPMIMNETERQDHFVPIELNSLTHRISDSLEPVRVSFGGPGHIGPLSEGPIGPQRQNSVESMNEEPLGHHVYERLANAELYNTRGRNMHEDPLIQLNGYFPSFEATTGRLLDAVDNYSGEIGGRARLAKPPFPGQMNAMKPGGYQKKLSGRETIKRVPKNPLVSLP